MQVRPKTAVEAAQVVAGHVPHRDLIGMNLKTATVLLVAATNTMQLLAIIETTHPATATIVAALLHQL